MWVAFGGRLSLRLVGGFSTSTTYPIRVLTPGLGHPLLTYTPNNASIQQSV